MSQEIQTGIIETGDGYCVAWMVTEKNGKKYQRVMPCKLGDKIDWDILKKKTYGTPRRETYKI